MGSQNELIIQVEGIAVQHCGELILGSPATGLARKDWKEAYWRALDEMALAIAFGTGITVSGVLPGVGGDNPGARLLEDLQPIVRKITISKSTQVDADGRAREILVADMIKPEYREQSRALREYIGLLDNAYTRDPSSWGEWIAREGITTFGKDPSLYSDNPSECVFQDVPLRGIAYLQDVELQGTISKNRCVEGLIQELGRYVNAGQERQFRKTSLREFVERNLLTHLAIFVWYQSCTSVDGEDRLLRLPFPTRATLLAASAKPSPEESVRRLMAPRLLVRVLRKCNYKHDLGKALCDLNQDPDVVGLRPELIAAIAESRKGNNKPLQDLATRMSSMIDIGAWPARQLWLRKDRYEKQYMLQMGNLFNLGSDAVRTEIDHNLIRLFPEMF